MVRLIESFPPVADARSRVLVLGTMPGEMSLRKQQYYGHPRNAFWPVIAALCGCELPVDYALRKELLLGNGFALWDVCRQCEREGSLDSNIFNETPNAIGELLQQYPQIRAIAFNGQGAARLFRRYFGKSASEYARLVLPSTSPAHAIPFDTKLEGWRAVLGFLEQETIDQGNLFGSGPQPDKSGAIHDRL